jgi:hypothetical protein
MRQAFGHGDGSTPIGRERHREKIARDHQGHHQQRGQNCMAGDHQPDHLQESCRNLLED